MSGLGFSSSEDPHVVYQGAVAGQPAATVNDSLAMKSPTTQGCAGSAGTVTLNGLGRKGGSASAQGFNSSYANTGAGAIYGAPNYYFKFITGTPGYYTTGYGAGQMNAGGGGFGGDGVFNPAPCSTSPSVGLIGSAGDAGGASGIGGNGGGGIYIKAANVILNTPNTVLIANGGNGSYGWEGGCGGRGGHAGAGGLGCISGSCINNWPGGYGACGDWGTGGNGGDGGDGGHPGTIWFQSPNPAMGTNVFTSVSLNVKGGKGGLGGYYGWGGGNATPAIVNVPNLCDGTFCFDPPATNCNPDPIMCFLKDCIHFDTVLGAPNLLRFCVTPGSPTPVKYVEFDGNTGGLYLIDHAAVVNWVQVTNAATSYNAFAVFGNLMNSYSAASNLADTTTNCGTSSPVTVRWYPKSIGIIDFAGYHRNSYNIPQFSTTDMGISYYAYFVTCDPRGYSGGTYAPGIMFPDRLRGRTGTDALDGTIDLAGGTGHGGTSANGIIGIGPPSPLFKTNTGVGETIQSVSNLSVYPNPTSGDIWLSLNSVSAQSADIRVLDATGREVYKQTIKLQTGDNKQLLKLNGISQGIYTLQLQTVDGKLTQQIIVN